MPTSLNLRRFVKKVWSRVALAGLLFFGLAASPKAVDSVVERIDRIRAQRQAELVSQPPFAAPAGEPAAAQWGNWPNWNNWNNWNNWRNWGNWRNF